MAIPKEWLVLNYNILVPSSPFSFFFADFIFQKNIPWFQKVFVHHTSSRLISYPKLYFSNPFSIFLFFHPLLVFVEHNVQVQGISLDYESIPKIMLIFFFHLQYLLMIWYHIIQVLDKNSSFGMISEIDFQNWILSYEWFYLN